MTGFFYDLLTWIENHLHSPLRIEDISIKSGYSKWHLQRMFNQYFGISLGKYIRNRKITNAALLIKMSQIPIVEICAENGFSSQQTFTRFFKKYYGVTPGYYRKTKFISCSYFQENLTLTWDLPVQHEDVTFEHYIFCHTHDKRSDHKEEKQEFVLSQRNESIDVFFYEKLTHFILGLYEKYFANSSCNESNFWVIATGFKRTLSIKEPVIYFNAGDITFLADKDNKFIKFYYAGFITDLKKFINHIYFNYLTINGINRKNSEPDFFLGCFFKKEDKGCIKGYYYIPLPDMYSVSDDK